MLNKPGAIKHKWEPSFLIVPIPLPSTLVIQQCQATVITAGVASLVAQTCVHPVRKRTAHDPSVPGFLQPDAFGMSARHLFRNFFLRKYLPGRSSFRTIVRFTLLLCLRRCKMFPGLHPTFISGKFLAKPKLPYFLSAVKLNLPKNTFAVDGVFRLPLVLPSVGPASALSYRQVSLFDLFGGPPKFRVPLSRFSELPFIAHLMKQK
jgi:hypothetical protein